MKKTTRSPLNYQRINNLLMTAYILLHFHPLFAVLIIPLMVVIAVASVPYVRYDADLSGDWFLSPKGRRMAAIAAGTALLVTPLWVLLD